MEPAQERPLVGIGVIVKRGDKILIGERLSNHGSGTWMIPGGHLEHGEPFEMAAIREVREETGLEDLKALAVVSLDNHIDYGRHYVSIGVLVDCPSGDTTDPEPDKSRNWQWVDPWHLPEPFFLPSKRVIENWLSGKFYNG